MADKTYEELEAERLAIHSAQHQADSHLGFFEGKKQRKLILGEGEDPAEFVAAREAKRRIMRGDQLSEMVQDALINRVEQPVGVNLMTITFDEFVRIRKDPDFESFASYAPKILCYTDAQGRPGKERARPLRAFVKNEVGMYKGRIVVCQNMPGDSNRGQTPYVQVKEQLTPTVEPDPFPAKEAPTQPDAKPGLRLVK